MQQLDSGEQRVDSETPGMLRSCQQQFRRYDWATPAKSKDSDHGAIESCAMQCEVRPRMV